mmetsp:Transcript_37555/g.72243  ORF Transcript_37555/g.72243 Transcript_37555/m.72243 type:complete len:209 (+) Transcript_37555:367-993(+)
MLISLRVGLFHQLDNQILDHLLYFGKGISSHTVSCQRKVFTAKLEGAPLQKIQDLSSHCWVQANVACLGERTVCCLDLQESWQISISVALHSITREDLGGLLDSPDLFSASDLVLLKLMRACQALSLGVREDFFIISLCLGGALQLSRCLSCVLQSTCLRLRLLSNHLVIFFDVVGQLLLQELKVCLCGHLFLVQHEQLILELCLKLL